MMGPRCSYRAIGSHFTEEGDKPFCPDELCVNALDRLNSFGGPMGLDARHLAEREAGFSSTRTSWFRVTKPAPNEARIGKAETTHRLWYTDLIDAALPV